MSPSHTASVMLVPRFASFKDSASQFRHFWHALPLPCRRLCRCRPLQRPSPSPGPRGPHASWRAPAPPRCCYVCQHGFALIAAPSPFLFGVTMHLAGAAFFCFYSCPFPTLQSNVHVVASGLATSMRVATWYYIQGLGRALCMNFGPLAMFIACSVMLFVI